MGLFRIRVYPRKSAAKIWLFLFPSLHRRQHRRSPATFIFHVLYMAGDAVWLVLSDNDSICARLSAAVMTLAASGAGRLSVDRIESLMTTRAR